MSFCMKSFIHVKFQAEGVHKFPGATAPKFSDVAFLANEHFHYFFFEVDVEVFHDDRDIEFIQFRRWCERLYQGTQRLDNKSCEMIAKELVTLILDKYGIRHVSVKVMEDNINGATVKFDNFP